jgi:hypothetical protein
MEATVWWRRDDHAGYFAAERVGRRRLLLVQAFAAQDVGKAESNGAHAHQHALGVRRFGYLDDTDPIGSAQFGDLQRSHQYKSNPYIRLAFGGRRL